MCFYHLAHQVATSASNHPGGAFPRSQPLNEKDIAELGLVCSAKDTLVWPGSLSLGRKLWLRRSNSCATLKKTHKSVEQELFFSTTLSSHRI